MKANVYALPLIFSIITLSMGCSSSTGGSGSSADGSQPINPPNTTVAGQLDSDSVSLSSDIFSINAASVDGNVANITFRAGDNLNNTSVPDGLEVRFIAEGGAITESCVLENAACSVTWIGQNPRPADFIVSILAYTLGNETFLDTNSNFLFDDGDLFNDIPSRVDVPEPFLDINDDKVYNVGVEPFVDNPSSGTANVYDGGDGLYSGPSCAHSTLCADHESIYVFKNMTLVMSEGQVSPQFTAVNPAPGGTVALTDSDVFALSFTLEDANGNSLPSNTPVSISIDDGIGSVFSGGSQVFPATALGPVTFNALLVGAEFNPLDPPDPGQVVVTVEMSDISYLFTIPATLSP